MALVKDPWELALMRNSGRRLAEVVAMLRENVRPGISTWALDEMAEKMVRDLGAVPSFKGYRVLGIPTAFPATICASPNEQIVHGIPTDAALADGDIISIDVGLVYGGYHSDCAFTIGVGELSAETAQLLDATEQSLYVGVSQALPGNRIGDIGHAIESYIEPTGFGIVQEYVGHGIGRRLHEPPSVPNYGKPGRGDLLKAGMCIAIEPMITLGKPDTESLEDGWTVVTADGSLSAHFEHTVAITPKGPEILTVLESNLS